MRLPTLLALLFVWSNPVQAAVVTECKSPSGYAYYVEGGLVDKKSSGWTEDKISGGRTILVRESSGTYDIIFSDSMERTISSREDGADIIVVHDSSTRKVLIINYPNNTMETWTFHLDSSGSGFAALSQSKYGVSVTVQKHSLMVAQCSR
jgi:hypothetical protein